MSVTRRSFLRTGTASLAGVSVAPVALMLSRPVATSSAIEGRRSLISANFAMSQSKVSDVAGRPGR